MKRLLLPENAYKCEGQELVFGKVFTDGGLVVSDDVAELIVPALVSFYGVEVEDVPETVVPDEDADPALTASQTKK